MIYIEPDELKAARHIAGFLQRPLLLSGEPGTGKTTYAEHIKGQDDNLYTFKTKSISNSGELFYTYDAISHFANKEKHVLNFIRLQALGIAIIGALGVSETETVLREHLKDDVIFRALKPDEQAALVKKFLKNCNGGKSVVLVDEIDKAPRDFPNDILNEIENYEFEIKELDLFFSLKDKPEKKAGIFVILTSNFEKNLPDAFLRRCIYHHIAFPRPKILQRIVAAHLGDTFENNAQVAARIQEFIRIRDHDAIQKKPATSELVDCIRYLDSAGKMGESLYEDRAALSTILKKNSDLETISPTPEQAGTTA